MDEIWKDIFYVDCLTNKVVDYRNFYSVSNYGNIKNLKTNKLINGDTSSKYGHIRVYLYKNGKRERFLKHRIIAHMFLELVENKRYIDHIDTNPLNNHVLNLRWCDFKENRNNPLTKIKYTGINNSQYGKTGKENKKSIKIIAIDLTTGEKIMFDGMREAERNGFAHSNISRSCKTKIPYKNKLWFKLEDYLNMTTLSQDNEETVVRCND